MTKGGLSDISICLEELKQSFMPKLAEKKKLFMFASLKHFIHAYYQHMLQLFAEFGTVQMSAQTLIESTLSTL